MSDAALLAFTTEVKPTKTFTIDGDKFEMLGVDHLSPEDEAHAMALFARHGVLGQQLDMETNVARGKEVAGRMRSTRIEVITKLTTVPKATVEKMPLTQQTRLLEAIQREVEDDDGLTGKDGGGED